MEPGVHSGGPRGRLAGAMAALVHCGGAEGGQGGPRGAMVWWRGRVRVTPLHTVL